MKKHQSQRKSAILWIFVFASTHAAGRSLSSWSSCEADRCNGSSCCVIDSERQRVLERVQDSKSVVRLFSNDHSNRGQANLLNDAHRGKLNDSRERSL